MEFEIRPAPGRAEVIVQADDINYHAMQAVLTQTVRTRKRGPLRVENLILDVHPAGTP
jgi:hypothetical protein